MPMPSGSPDSLLAVKPFGDISIYPEGRMCVTCIRSCGEVFNPDNCFVKRDTDGFIAICENYRPHHDSSN